VLLAIFINDDTQSAPLGIGVTIGIGGIAKLSAP